MSDSVSASFRIPAALDAAGRLVVPDEARPRARYRCADCDGAVDLHAGEKKRRHFHHRTGTCTSESVLHSCAKQLVAQAVNDWLAGGPAVVFVRTCAARDCAVERRQSIPSKVGGVRVEHGLPSGHVADVALLGRASRDGQSVALPLPVALIEILHTHAVGAEKAMEMAVPWIEVDADQACATAGRVLVAVTDRFVPWFCKEHESERGKELRANRSERATAAKLARQLPFRLTDFAGFRIARVTQCPNGHDALVFAWDGKEPPWPRPPLVVAVPKEFDWSFRKAGGRPAKTMAWRRSYASACATCGAVLEQPIVTLP